ncbi:hypothetical protein [Kiloniella sp. b19]|uniref:hypothetical protein n=1 Tax=Kiloniella sp. GXU_MW_B19 TaxID=3141326 RepID=UPI0031E389B4
MKANLFFTGTEILLKSVKASCALIWNKRFHALLVTVLMLSGCGFRPLYQKQSGQEQTVVGDFQTVQIAPLSGREGQILHNFLRDRINPYGQPSSPRYLLQVDVTESESSVSTRSDGTSSRSNQQIVATYNLIDLAAGKSVFINESRSTNSFDSFTNEYSTLVSEETARSRNLSVIADDIRLKLGIFFSRQN